MNILLFSLIVSLGINLIMFIPAYVYKTDKITDISYAVTFIVVALAGYLKSDRSPLHTLLFIYILCWAIRIGAFLFMRIQKMKVDKRFDGMREYFFKFIRFWILQGMTVFVVMLASTLGFMQTFTQMTIVTYLGALIFVIGLAIEAAADAQKFNFTNNAKNKGTFIDTGVWRASRHPNYLGEIMVWFGLYLVVLPSLDGVNMLWALISPVYITVLLLFVSGVPLLEKSADKKWGDTKEYKTYKKAVPVLLPSLSSIRRAITKKKEA